MDAMHHPAQCPARSPSRQARQWSKGTARKVRASANSSIFCRSGLGHGRGRSIASVPFAPNAFSRYERGEVRPLPAVINMFRALDKHPELLAELR